MSEEEAKERESGAVWYSSMPKPSADEAIKVHWKVYFNEIFSIDSVNQKANLSVFFATYWKDDRLVERDTEVEDENAYDAYKFKDDVDPEEMWVPVIELVNAADDGEISEEAREVVTIPGEGPYVIVHNVFRGSVSAPMDLKQFPFDRQILPLKFRSANFPIEDCVLVVSDEASKSMIRSLDPRCANPEFTIKAVYAVSDKVLYPMLAEIEGETRATYCEYRIEFLLERKPSYYMDKVWVQFNFIAVMDFFVAMLLQGAIGDRNSVALTLFLTAIALSFAVAGDLPKISYRTRMDTFILLNYANLFLIYVSNFFVYFWYDQSGDPMWQTTPSAVQTVFGVFVVLIWVLSNVWFVLPLFFMKRKSRGQVLNPNLMQLLGWSNASQATLTHTVPAGETKRNLL
jgi:heme/copper-type cytochrome/quinol oxidase subunit 4